VQPGDIYRHEAFYVDEETGRPAPKYLLVLAVSQRDDIVGRPYGGYFLGVPGTLREKTWIDLRPFDDLDPIEFRKREESGTLVLACALPMAMLRSVLECVAGADDTTRHQERRLRDTLAGLR
jgi:hypothetical protein